MQTFGISEDLIIKDLPITFALLILNLFVIFFLSRWVYEYAIKKGRTQHSAMYFGRKIIHLFAGGLTAILLPFYLNEPLLPTLLAIGFAIMTYTTHKINKLMYWFQDPENMYEVNFCLVWAGIIFSTWFIDKSFWLGVIPVLFMAWGDGITGIIRNLKYSKRTKAWEGTFGMLALDIAIGSKLGIAGVIAAILTAFVERIEFLDDNLSVPLVALLILLIAKFYFPSLLLSFI
ncbi:MAG: dolichol kinase [Candidatus Micrarchaeia archaeon]|jgi:dolichol kinase